MLPVKRRIPRYVAYTAYVVLMLSAVVILRDVYNAVPQSDVYHAQSRYNDAQYYDRKLNYTYQRRQDNTTWTVVYDSVHLYNTVKKVHDANWLIQPGDTCTQRKPGVAIVGVAKCGTRELTDFMALHPQIVIRRTEDEMYQINQTYFTNPKKRSKIHENMPCSYSHQIGMFKADAFFHSRERATQIHSINPNMKIIVIVREPLSRVLSHLTFLHYLKVLKNNTEGRQGTSPTPNYDKSLLKALSGPSFMLTMSTYDKSLEYYQDIFPKSQILVIEANEFKHDPVSVFYRVSEFLELAPFNMDSYFVYNEEKKFYCIRNPEFDHHMSCYTSRRGRSTPIKIKPDTRKRMLQFFKPHNERFFKILGKRYDWPS